MEGFGLPGSTDEDEDVSGRGDDGRRDGDSPARWCRGIDEGKVSGGYVEGR